MVKKKNDKKDLYSWYKRLIILGVFICTVVTLDLISEIKEIIYLYDSGMSFDMINLIPEHFWGYVWGIIECISIFIGCKNLRKVLLTYQKYAEYINIDKKSSLRRLAKDIGLPIEVVQNDLMSLKDTGYLNFSNISDNQKIIYDTSDETKNNLKNKTLKIQCSKCGAINKVKSSHCIECNFCGSKIIGDN